MFNKLCILTALRAAPAVATSLRGVGGGAFPAPLSTNTTNTTQPGRGCWVAGVVVVPSFLVDFDITVGHGA